jgi:biopolymer transport protein ExbB
MALLTLLQTAPAAPLAPGAGKATLASLYEMILAGGPMMVPIGICSIVALGFLVERLAALTPTRLVPSNFKEGVSAALELGDKQALAYCEQRPKAAIARVFAVALRRWDEPRVEVERAAEGAGGREIGQMTRRLRAFAVITTIAPLLGLLGTVIGIIQAFQVLSLQKGLGKPEMLAGGISQALVATAAGLCVAIPSQVAYYWLRSKVERFAGDLETLFAEVIGRKLDEKKSSQLEAA